MAPTPGSSDPLGEEGSAAPDEFPDDRSAALKAQNDAWAVVGLLISGVVVWGGIGLLVSHWLHNAVFVMLGLLLGTGTALYGIWVRLGRS